MRRLLPGLLVLPLLVHLSSGFWIPRQIHGDERWTMLIVLSQAWNRMGERIMKDDNHPPLYYFLAKGWTILTQGEVHQLRWMSFLFTVLTICALAWLHRTSRQSEKIFALGLLGTNPLLTYYTGTVRPYALVVLLAAVMTISAFQLKRLRSFKGHQGLSHGENPMLSWSLLYYGSALFLGLTHYFGTLYVWVATIGDLITRRIETKPWKGLILLILTALWPLAQFLFGSVNEQTSSNAWIKVLFLISTINNFLAGNFPLLMISKSIPQYSFGVVLALLLLAILLRPAIKSYGQTLKSQGISLQSIFAPDAMFWSAVCASILAVGCILDTILPFTTPYYFLVCLPAVSLLLGKLFAFSIRDRFTAVLSYLLIASIAALQIVQSHLRLAFP